MNDNTNIIPAKLAGVSIAMNAIMSVMMFAWWMTEGPLAEAMGMAASISAVLGLGIALYALVQKL